MPGFKPGMSGGEKQLWLRLHRDEVLAFFEAHGEVATRERYNIVKDTTWEHFLKGRQVRVSKLTKADRAIARAEIAEQGLRDVRHEVSELKDSYGRFVPLLADQITDKFFKPLLSGKIELPPELEYKPKPDPLRITPERPRITPPRPRITPKRPRIS